MTMTRNGPCLKGPAAKKTAATTEWFSLVDKHFATLISHISPLLFSANVFTTETRKVTLSGIQSSEVCRQLQLTNICKRDETSKKGTRIMLNGVALLFAIL